MSRMIKTRSFELSTYMRGSQRAKRLAMILPGKLDTKDYPHMRSLVNYLAKKGYLALSFDPPGTWESPGSIGLYTMTNYLRAIDGLIEKFGSRPTVLFGHSRGGIMAMLAGAQNGAVTHIMTAMSQDSPSPMLPGTREVGFQKSLRDTPTGGTREFLLPVNYFDDAKKYDVGSMMSKCTKPKLFIYGVNDTLVEPQDVMEVYDRSAPPKEIRPLDSEHDYRLHPKIIDKVNDIVGTFLDKYK